MVFPQGTSICLTGGRGTGKSESAYLLLFRRMCLVHSFFLTAPPPFLAKLSGPRAGGVPCGAWHPGPLPPPPLAGVGADVQAGRRLLHKPKKRSPVLFLVQPRSVEALVLLARPVFRGWLEPSRRVKCLVDKASEPKHFKSRVLWIHDFMVLSLKAGRLN